MKSIFLLPLLFSMTDQRGLNVEIYKLSDTTRLEVWHRNDTIFRKKAFTIFYQQSPVLE